MFRFPYIKFQITIAMIPAELMKLEYLIRRPVRPITTRDPAYDLPIGFQNFCDSGTGI